MVIGKEITGKILLDTNVLIYATLEDDFRHAAAREALDLRLRRDVDVFVSVQNLAEMYPNLTGPKCDPVDSPAIARKKIESIRNLRGVHVLPMNTEVIARALKLCEKYGITRQLYFDMQLVGLMLEEGIVTIVTENVNDFQLVDEIRVFDPFR